VRLINETLNRYGRIDVLINNAGVSMRALFADLDLLVMRQLMETNFFGTVYCTKYALRQLIKYKGSVVGISSVAGYQGLPARTGYSASKFAMEGFLSALRVENSRNGLHVLIVNPGFTESNIRNTALMADGRAQGTSPRDEKAMMTSAEVADRIFMAVKSRRRRLVMSREGKLSYYLGKLFPELVDNLVYKALLKEHDSPLKGR
jgi:short-subunit dehydrogenase